MSALGSSEASAPQRFKCISIMGDSNGGSATVRSRGGVLSREGPYSEVPLYILFLYRNGSEETNEDGMMTTRNEAYKEMKH